MPLCPKLHNYRHVLLQSAFCISIRIVIVSTRKLKTKQNKQTEKNYGPIVDVREHRNLLKIKFVIPPALLICVHRFKPVQEAPNPIQKIEC